MKRKSTLLFSVLLILLLFVGTIIFLFRQFILMIQNDASTINDLGIIRGSIQRLSKLEISYQANDDLREKINSLIVKYKEKDITSLQPLEEKWMELESLTATFRSNPNQQNHMLYLKKSEECWTVADQMVLDNQYIAENKIKYLMLPITLLVLNLMVVFVLLFMVKRYVYDTLENSSISDPLTKVFNRRYFMEFLNHEIIRANRKNDIFCLVMLDIDRFKKINDTFGHDLGDHVLETVAAVAQKDIRKSDVFSRIGGEEFTLLLPDTSLDKALIMAERVRSNIESHAFKQIGKVTVSLGVAAFQHGDSADSIMKRADVALYHAKENGRNRIEAG